MLIGRIGKEFNCFAEVAMSAKVGFQVKHTEVGTASDCRSAVERLTMKRARLAALVRTFRS